jgi:hypothetical protein
VDDGGSSGEASRELRSPEHAPEDEFETLVEHLRAALQAQGGKGKVWLPESERKAFKIVLVDKVSCGCGLS